MEKKIFTACKNTFIDNFTRVINLYIFIDVFTH